MTERYGEAWVCLDCYFAHHYGAHQETYDLEIAMPDGTLCDSRDVELWFAGEDDEPVGGWWEIQHNHSLQHNREPLAFLEGYELADNTCSNHEWDREMECPVCDDGNVGPGDHPEYLAEWPWVDCWVCEGTGTLTWPCSECGQDSDEDGIQEFDWDACDGCHSPLGGSRHRLSLWKREEVTT